MTENNKVQNIVQKIIDITEIPESDKYGSAIVLLMVASIVLTAIRILQECRNKEIDQLKTYHNQIIVLCNKKSWITKMRLRRLIRRELDSDEYKKYGEKLLDSILKIGSTLTEEETKTLMEAANV